MRRNEKRAHDAAYRAAQSEVLLTESAGYVAYPATPNEQRFLEAEGMEKTFKFKQQDIARHVDVTSAKKVHSNSWILM
jgi:U3 small nucleolar RNA-associated protein 7